MYIKYTDLNNIKYIKNININQYSRVEYYKIYYSLSYQNLYKKDKEFFIYYNAIDYQLYRIKKNNINQSIKFNKYVLFIPLNYFLLLRFENNDDITLINDINNSILFSSNAKDILNECLLYFSNNFIDYYNKIITKINTIYLLQNL